GTIRIVQNRMLVRTVDAHGGGIWTLAASADGSLVVTSGDDGYIRVWRTSDWSRTGDAGGDQQAILRVVLSPDGTRVATGGFDTTVRIWSVEDRAEVLRLPGHIWSVHAVAFAPDGTLYSGGTDGQLREWRVQPGWSWDRSS